MKKETQGLRTWIKVDTARLAHNIGIFKNAAGPAKIMAVTKSNAYGHGLVDFSKAALAAGVDWVGVDSIVEGLRLRMEGVDAPILILGFTLGDRVNEAVELGIHLTASSFEALLAWSELVVPQKIKIHIKVDTGLHRQGFLFSDLPKVIEFLKSHLNQFQVEGLYTHFAKAKDPGDRSYTGQQLAEFNQWVAAFKKAGFSPIVHAAASAGALIYPEARFDMVRIGIGLYGIWPSDPVRLALQDHMTLKPILSWKTLIAEKKQLPQGAGIGYDLSETLTRDSVIAICPIGYWHGFPRNLSSIGEVIVSGKKCKVLGRVAMDMVVVDITDVPEANYCTDVTLIGSDNSIEISAEALAVKAGMTSYEIITRLNPLIKRIYS